MSEAERTEQVRVYASLLEVQNPAAAKMILAVCDEADRLRDELDRETAMNEESKLRRETRNRELELGGGLAFPVPVGDVDGTIYDSEEYCAGNGGMTLRDYFAAAALTGMLSYSLTNPLHGNWVENASHGVVATDAYRYADAMLKARKETSNA